MARAAGVLAYVGHGARVGAQIALEAPSHGGSHSHRGHQRVAPSLAGRHNVTLFLSEAKAVKERKGVEAAIKRARKIAGN